MRSVRKFKPISFIGFGGEIVNLYPATFNKAELSGLTLEPFVCYVDLDRCSGNSLIGTDLISVCMVNRSMGNYAIDLALNDYAEYTRKFVDNYIASMHADINILEELCKLSKSIDNCRASKHANTSTLEELSRQPSSSDLYLEDLFGAASAAIGK